MPLQALEFFCVPEHALYFTKAEQSAGYAMNKDHSGEYPPVLFPYVNKR